MGGVRGVLDLFWIGDSCWGHGVAISIGGLLHVADLKSKKGDTLLVGRLTAFGRMDAGGKVPWVLRKA